MRFQPLSKEGSGLSLKAILSKEKEEEEPSLSFKEVLSKEIDVVRQARIKRQMPQGQDPLEKDLVGMAFSGGGIRSATFNLGVIQALASANLLKFIDYLSTVSGGGYIGSWLSSWAYHVSQKPGAGQNHIAQVEAELNRRPEHPGDDTEPRQVHFLRKYSNYLTPRLGMFSGDTMAFVATYLRNLLLNQMILISALLAVLLLPRTLVSIFRYFHGENSALWSAGLGVILLAISLVGVGLNAHKRNPYGPRAVFWLIALPQVLFCILAAYSLWQFVTIDGWVKQRLLAATVVDGLWVVGASMVAYAVLWFASVSFGTLLEPPAQGRARNSYQVWAPVLWSFPAGALAGLCLLFVSHNLSRGEVDAQSVAKGLTFFVPLVTMSVMLVGTVHLGMIGRAYPDGLREWWARLAGLVLLMTLGWFFLCLVTLFCPLWLVNLWHFITGTGGSRVWKFLSGLGITGAAGGWITATLKGLFAAKGDKTGPSGPAHPSKDRLASLAPPIFVLGLVVILSMSLYWLVPRIAGGTGETDYWCILATADWKRLLALFVGLWALSAFLGRRVDVNEFSLHTAYRNRIVRCYLGATNDRRSPQLFTGFDESDNILMHWLKDLGAPFHIVNATLNVVKGKELALQSRKGRSFAFTPLYSGFDYRKDETRSDVAQGSPGQVTTSDPEQGQGSGCYRLTENYSKKSLFYRGGRLGTAMAISGAAASPNMGHYTTGAVSFLLTIFSVRLGWWLGSPKFQSSWESEWPRSSWKALMNELTGMTNEDQNEVYLSDGGHFENLAIYELVRRRCRLIIVCDAGADHSYGFGDLTSAIEKCRVDFGTRIEIKLQDVYPSEKLFPDDTELRESKSSYARGTIYYPDNTEGTFIYVKPTLKRELSRDVLAYARQYKWFPHQSTADQFFDESQFESYRALGFACAKEAIQAIAPAVQSA
jgi:predicted acylesterase/phospholipase RssA